MIDTSRLTLEELLAKEILETNGLGGYASMSICGANTRKYHGILVASFNPPTERKTLVAKVEEKIIIDEGIKELSVNQYPGVTHPNGHQYLKSFERKPVAQWSFGEKNWSLIKRLFMVQGSNTTMLQYENTGKKSMEIQLHPLFSHKEHHGNFYENHFDFYYEKQNSGIKIYAYPDSPPLYFSWSKGTLTEQRSWYKNIQLYREAYRGTESSEDYYCIGFLTTSIKPGQSVSILFTTEQKMVEKKAMPLLRKVIKAHQSKKVRGIRDRFYYDLLAAGDQFLVDRFSTRSKTIIAGYHWFTDWGRDTMIAMRGITIATGNQVASKSILSTFFKYLDQGMLPNYFPDYDGQEIEYNTIDATLWLFIALHEYVQKFKDVAFIKKHIKKLESIIKFHMEGTRYNIKMTEEGFIYGGEEGWQLTWMDARVDGFVVTPRIGCPVEITMLWYNALKIFDSFCKKIKYTSKVEVAPIIKKIEKHFKTNFLNDKGYLNDVVVPKEKEDDTFRCNQIYAVSLPFGLLSLNQEKKIVKLVGEKLLTGMGLRSLDIENPAFKSVYEGDQWSRDTAYHQGTVWTFLIAEYCEAYLKVNKFSEKAKKQVKNWLELLKHHFYNDDCIHGISEIFDGLHPKDGRGCINQAWSVAALIRLYAQYQLYKLK